MRININCQGLTFNNQMTKPVLKHIHGKLDQGDAMQHLLLSFRELPGFQSKRVCPFFFQQGPSDTSQKTAASRIRHQRDENGLIDLEATKHILAQAKKNICINSKKSDNQKKL